MNNLVAIVPIAASAYVATNLDNLVMLVSLLARYRHKTPYVAAGYLVCMLALGLIGFAIGEAADSAPIEYLGLLGFVPISIGLVGIIRLFRAGDASASAARVASTTGGAVFVATFLAQMGNGADTILTFGVLFADSLPSADRLIIVTLAAMAVGFVSIAKFAVHHPELSDAVERYAHRVTPFILIGVGLYIIANTATDIVPQ